MSDVTLNVRKKLKDGGEVNITITSSGDPKAIAKEVNAVVNALNEKTTPTQQLLTEDGKV